MLEWITANWIWLVLALGAGWFLLRRKGAGHGLGGHGRPHAAAPRTKELERGDHDEHSTTRAGSPDGSRHRGGCC